MRRTIGHGLLGCLLLVGVSCKAANNSAVSTTTAGTTTESSAAPSMSTTAGTTVSTAGTPVAVASDGPVDASLADLVKRSPLIVEATVDRIFPLEKDFTDEVNPDGIDVVSTHLVINVVVAGKSATDSIVLDFATGSKSPYARPVPVVGARFLLFLQVLSPQQSRATHGAVAMLTIEGDRTLKAFGGGSPEVVDSGKEFADGKSADSVEAEIRAVPSGS